ncbi:hypothetical protein Ahy_A04g018387 [Arachis hypogaea]|uniref:Uncharacterized protein n=1 Tax=Arachis hypogaea TaxID=3818 RepID=A0A445DDI9_ARAHY|nr:hypothetical protein Ahy_A04g018387 [Arachis hypogaea]
MLEISINMIDACCKYFLDDLASRNQQTIRLAYMYFSFFIAVRNELGYFAVFFRRFDVMLMPREKPALPEEESRERKEEDDRWAALPCSGSSGKSLIGWGARYTMGCEVYDGEHGKLYSIAIPLYTIGYWYRARCLMLTWAITGLMSLAVEPIE